MTLTVMVVVCTKFWIIVVGAGVVQLERRTAVIKIAKIISFFFIVLPLMLLIETTY